ncbi:MAG TPA: alpha/beta fold hydrolase [Vicinamibacterales bacterium]|nr:alpha/beta fold hydrolase [Vicinamibacterales bacterium]
MKHASATAIADSRQQGAAADAEVTERARRFGDDNTLVGIVTEPPAGVTPRAAVVLMNAGVVHRVGPNRMHVEIARGLAARGFVVVRLDLSGLGDSESRRDNTPFERAAVMEAQSVMTAITADYGVSEFITGGLCSGAVVAFNTAVADQRVCGAVLINPQGFVSSAEWNDYVVSRAKARKYWRQKLFSLQSWRKALTGKSQYRLLAGIMKRRAESLVTRNESVAQVADGLAGQFASLQARGTRLLLACSEDDLGLEYLKAILGRHLGRGGNVQTLMLPRGDHSLTMAVSRRQFQTGVEQWVRR